MILLYHDFIKNARNIFWRGVILCFAVGLQNDKIFYFWNLSSKKSLTSAFKLLSIVVPMGLFTRCFSFLSVDCALEFSSSFPVWLFVVFSFANIIFDTCCITLFTKDAKCFFKGHILSCNTRHLF